MAPPECSPSMFMPRVWLRCLEKEQDILLSSKTPSVPLKHFSRPPPEVSLVQSCARSWLHPYCNCWVGTNLSQTSPLCGQIALVESLNFHSRQEGARTTSLGESIPNKFYGPILEPDFSPSMAVMFFLSMGALHCLVLAHFHSAISSTEMNTATERLRMAETSGTIRSNPAKAGSPSVGDPELEQSDFE